MIPKPARIWSNRNSHKLLMGMKNGITTSENSAGLCFFTKLNILLPYDPEIVLLGSFSKELKFILHKNLCMDAYSNFNHNCQIFKATQMSFSWWMTNCGTFRQWILFNLKEWTIKPWADIRKPLKFTLLHEKVNLKRLGIVWFHTME